jgi:hypothetical protein
MCSGGGGGGTITVPDYGAYNNQFQLQKSAIESAMNNGTRMMQSELTASLRKQEAAYERLTDQAKLQAENTNAQAMRMMTLIGTPEPEKSAEAPKVGASARGLKTDKGKGALRIARETAGVANKGGSGLNITTSPV